MRDPVRWAFHNQVFFLAEYIEGYQASTQELAHGSRVICLDYTAHELAIYTDAMKERGFIDMNEYRCIKKIFDMFEPMLYEPDLLIYLHASIDTIIERIQHRNRQFETEMDRRYLDHLQYGFDRFIASWTKGTVVKVDSEKIDFLHNDDVVRLIATQALNTIAPSN